MKNQQIAKIFLQIADLLSIKGRNRQNIFKAKAYQKAGLALQGLAEDVAVIYKTSGLKGLTKLTGIGKSTALDIEQYLKKGKIKRLDELQQETAIQQVITHFFESKGVNLKQLKNDAKKRNIVYSRYTKPAKQLIELAGSVEKAKKAITKVADWANSRKLDYTIETVFKKWLELDRLKPKEIVKKPFYDNSPMVWSEARKKWFVISKQGEWLLFADKESKIEWRIC